MAEQGTPTTAPANTPSNGKAIASLVLGICGVGLSFWGYFSIAGLILGIIGLILGINAKKTAPSGMATAGIVLSIIAIILSAIFFIACVACLGALATQGTLY